MSRQAIQAFLAIDFNQVSEEERLNSILNTVVAFSAKIFTDVPDTDGDEASFNEDVPRETMLDAELEFNKRVCELLFPLRRDSFAARRELALLMYRMAENDYPLSSMPTQIQGLLQYEQNYLLSVLNKDLSTRMVEATKLIDPAALSKLSPEKQQVIEADLKRYLLMKLAAKWIGISAEGGDAMACILQQRLLIDASLSARCTGTALQLELTPITEEMFFSICKKSLNKVGGEDFWKQYLKDNQPPFSLSFLLQKWTANKHNSCENIEVKALLENAELPTDDINVLWVWWLQSQKKTESDTVSYYLEHGPGFRKVSIARDISEKYFSKLDESFRSDIVMHLQAFIGEGHYCSKPLFSFLLEDSKKVYLDTFFQGLLKTKEIAEGWAAYFAPQAIKLQQTISKALRYQEVLILSPGTLVSQEAHKRVPTQTTTARPDNTLNRAGTGVPPSMLFSVILKDKALGVSQGSLGDENSEVDVMELEQEEETNARKRKAEEPADQNSELTEAKRQKTFASVV